MVPTEQIYSVLLPWSFYQWVLDILGSFSLVTRQLKFILITVEYFMKWIEAELLKKSR